MLGDLLGANYTIDPAVQGSVTLQTSRPLPRDDLIPTLELLLRMNGAALVFNAGVYNVVPVDSAIRGMISPQLGNSKKALPTGYTVRIVPLKHIGASEMQKILEPFATAGNIVRVDSRRNLLILAGSGPEVTRLLETVDIFDVDWLEGMSVALFTPDFVDAATLAKELEVVFGKASEGPLAGLIEFVPLERLNAILVITARPQYLEKARAWVERLDRDTGGVGRRLYVYHVQNGKAADLAAVLSEVFSGEAQGPALPPAELAPGLEPVTLGAASREVTREVTVEGQPPAEEVVAESGAGQMVGPDSAEVEARVSSTVSGGVAISESGQIRIIADEVNNALLILATGQQYKQVEAALKRLDIVPLQVLIDATIAEISLEGELEYGMEWFFKNKVDDKTGRAVLDLNPDASDSTFPSLAPLVPGFSYSIVDAANQVRAVLNALAADQKLNVLSSPSLMVLNNQKASIQVGDEVPVATQEQQSAVAGDAPLVNTIEFRNTGVLLTVTPRVNAGGLVIMDVEQEVSNVVSSTEQQGADLTPTIQQRKINSTVAVQSGQTVVLGGLIREQRTLSRSGIPGLYNLPLIGPLFGVTQDEQTRTELVVLITPRAVQDAEDAAEVTEEFRNKMESLRPIAPPKGPEVLEGEDEAPRKGLLPRVGDGLVENDPGSPIFGAASSSAEPSANGKEASENPAPASATSRPESSTPDSTPQVTPVPDTTPGEPRPIAADDNSSDDDLSLSFSRSLNSSTEKTLD